MAKFKKKYIFLFILVIIGILVGILFSNIINTEDSKLVSNKITEYFNNIKNDTPIDYIRNLFTSIKNNLFYLVIVWILGISIIGLLFNNFILFFKSFIIGFSIGSIINIYLYSGLILSFFYIFPSHLINLFILLMMVNYANDFSIKLFNVIFRKKEYHFQLIIKSYLKILGIFTIIIIINSLIETFIMPFFLKLFSFLIK